MFVLPLYDRVTLNRFATRSPKEDHAGSLNEHFRSIYNTLVQEQRKNTLLDYSIEVHRVEIPQKERKQAYKTSDFTYLVVSHLQFHKPQARTDLAALSKSHGSEGSHDVTSKISAM